MKKSAGIILIGASILLFTPCSYISAQQFVPTPVTVSSEKINVRGTILYVHKVLKGQTLYSVSKAYGVPIEAIIEQNPSLKDGLKTGGLIYIPLANEKIAKKAEKESINESSISQEEKEIKKKYKKYTVKWYETLSDVASRFNVSQEAIIDLNRLGDNPVLKKKQVLLIPDKEYKIAAAPLPRKEVDEVAAEVKFPEPEQPIAIQENLYTYSGKRTYKISLVLPLGTSAGTESANVNFMDFYSGTLLALDDFQEETGMRYFSLNVVDLSDYYSSESLIASGVLEGSEIIIGPVFEKNLAAISIYAQSRSIPIVSPMDPRAEHLIKGNPFFFQFPTPYSYIQKNIIDKAASGTPEDSISTHLYFEKGTASSTLVTTMIEDLEAKNIIFDTLSYGILEGRGIDTIMLERMDTVHRNRVLVASESEAFVSDILRNLHLLQSTDTISIEVFGQPRWKNFDIIELEYFHLLDTHLSLQYYVDYNSPKTKKFVTDYWKTFNAEPTPYAFQGYDVLTYFLSALSEFGREFPSHITGYKKSLLQSDISFIPTGDGSGFENRSTRNIVYRKGWNVFSW